MIIALFLLLAMCLPVRAATLYVSTGGVSSGNCQNSSNPCNWLYATQTVATGSDTVLFNNGTYTTPSQGWLSARDGTNNNARITLQAINRRQAKIQYGGADGDAITMFVRDDNYTIRGFEISCLNSSGGTSRDCIKAGSRDHQAAGEPESPIKADNITFEDVYVHHAGGGLFHCTGATNIAILNSTLDSAGATTPRGEGFYLGSCCQKNNPCVGLKAYNNIISRYSENAIDFKSQARNVDVRYSIYTDQRTRLPDAGENVAANTVGDPHFVSQNGGGTNPGTTAYGNIVQDSMIFRALSRYMFHATDGMRFDGANNVIWSFDPVNPAHGNGKLNGSDETVQAESYGNIHCPASDNVSENFDKDHGKAPNQLNQANSVCSARINEIIGIPSIASCEIGNVSSTTVVVNLTAALHGPVSSVGAVGDINVQYNSVSQTETAVSIPNTNQARITVASAPANGNVPVRVVAAIGAIKNSAFIGGKDCKMSVEDFKTDLGGTNRDPIIDSDIGTGGVCGSNTTALTMDCTNNVSGGPPPPDPEALTQAVWRFYGPDGAEGANALAPELTNVLLPLGAAFRWRVGVRGGGSTSASRTYELAARVCNPACGSWLEVSESPASTGVLYRYDAVQDNLAVTTNQLSLGGKNFLAGAFLEQLGALPAVSIQTTEQVEWEFSLVLASQGSPLVAGNTIELRMQHNDGTALSSYTLAHVTVAAPPVNYGKPLSGLFDGGAFQ